jgi:hypothetical protein
MPVFLQGERNCETDKYADQRGRDTDEYCDQDFVHGLVEDNFLLKITGYQLYDAGATDSLRLMLSATEKSNGSISEFRRIQTTPGSVAGMPIWALTMM